VGRLIAIRCIAASLAASVRANIGLPPFFQNIVPQFDLDIYFGSRHDAGMKILFMQLRWASDNPRNFALE